MNNFTRFSLAMLFIATTFFTACDDGITGVGDDESDVTFENADIPGEAVSVSVGSLTVKMIYANNSAADIILPYETDDSDTVYVSGKFFVSETEITNALFAAVLQWARDNDRISESGTDNLVSDTTVTYGGQELIDLDFDTVYPQAVPRMSVSYDPATDIFSVASGCENFPVVCVSWYGAVMFCNWLTEMRDGNTANVVYTGIDTTWEDTETSANEERTGYRLPSNAEWEHAARYNGTSDGGRTDLISLTTNNPNSLDITAGFYWTPGDYVSGATGDYSDTTATRAVAWYAGDSGMGSYNQAMQVGQKTPNQLGVRDMSGNVWEWCFDSYMGNRVIQGGSWNDDAFHTQLGYWSCYDADFELAYIGFRIARTQ
jgi:formylglycine-generating enzyme required for sulfatase activity